MAYDEDIIVDLISKLYQTLEKLDVFQPGEVVWPPAGGHQVDTSPLPPEAMPDPRVLLLMNRLPIGQALYTPILPSMGPVDFRCRQGLLRSRYIDREDDEEHEKPAAPTAFMLLDEHNDWCTKLVLDVADNTICEYGWELGDEYKQSKGDLANADDYGDSYVDWPTEDATAYLQRRLDEFRDGKLVVAVTGGAIMSTEPPHFDGAAEAAELARVLKEEYGWPDEFREQDWKRDREDVEARVMRTDEEA